MTFKTHEVMHKMNQKTLNKLEFTKIIELLAEHASSPGGKMPASISSP